MAAPQNGVVPVTAPLVITGWSAVSAAGTTAGELSAAVRSEGTGPKIADDTERSTPTGTVPGFDIRKLLGHKNTRTMDRLTALTVLTVGRLLDGERSAGYEIDGSGTALVLGTTTGSVQSMMDFSRDSFTQDKPYLVDPARFPNAVMNCAAGHSAIWHGLRGPNTTIASGQVAGLSVLRYAARLHHSGHAHSVLCGAVEELSPQRMWLEAQQRHSPGLTPLGEACAIFRLESLDDAVAASRRPLAELVATTFRVCASLADVPRVLAGCAASVMKAANVDADQVWAVAADLTDAQHDGLAEVAGGNARRIGLPALLGDTGAASAALHLAAVLSYAQVDQAAHGRLALIAAVDRDGSVGVCGLRLLAGRG